MKIVVDSVRAWLTERCGSSADTVAGVLYADYASWISPRIRFPVPSVRAFGMALSKLGYARRKSNGLQLYIGLALRKP